MRLLVEKITDISRAYTLSLSAEELNAQLGQLRDDASGSFVGEALIHYRLSRIDRRLLIEGELSAELSLRCGRCLTALVERIQEPFSIVLNIVETEGPAGEELELDEEQINSICVADGEVDLLPVLQEQLLMSLPIHSLCREDCAGLCPHCGVDQNISRCDCEPKHFNNRFGKLKDLRFDRS